jgi:hypothetical protein
VKSFAKGVEEAGHTVEIVDAWSDEGIKLAAAEYVVIITQSTSLIGGKMPECLGRVLAQGHVDGKRGAAFIRKGLFNGKSMHNAMKSLEKEGVFVNWSDIILNAPHAEALGKRIGS